MIEGTFWIIIAEAFFALFTGTVLWRIFVVQNYIKNMADNVDTNKQEIHKQNDILKHIELEVARLREEHREIMNSQTRSDEKADKFSDTVSQKVEQIMRDHNSHEVGQGRIETKLEVLLSKDKK